MRNLAKVGVEGSNPFTRSIENRTKYSVFSTSAKSLTKSNFDELHGMNHEH